MSRGDRPISVRADPWGYLRAFTAARIALGRAGASLPTAPLLEFQLAHARARDAVHHELDAQALRQCLEADGWPALVLHSAAPDRATYIRRPDLGRILDPMSADALRERAHATPDVAVVVADGLSALAVQRHALPLLSALRPHVAAARWSLTPVCIVRQGRVAVGDEVGALLGAKQCVLLIGERPGLSSPDSLGIYFTHDPLPGRTNAERNCLSNVRPEGLDYDTAAGRLCYLMHQARRLGASGVMLKEAAPDRLLTTDAETVTADPRRQG